MKGNNMKRMFLLTLLLYVSASSVGRWCQIPGGNDANTGLSLVQAYLTPQLAIDSAKPSDTVFLCWESITISKTDTIGKGMAYVCHRYGLWCSCSYYDKSCIFDI
jgi:hypothetical protein